MDEDEIVTGSLMDESWLTLEQVAATCHVDTGWLLAHLDGGSFPADAVSASGVWRFSGTALTRVRRMRQLERDFDAVPELAALFADLMEELDALRAHARTSR